MSIPLHQLAQELGLSISTVSRALSGKGRVGEKTRQRIEAYAKERGYVPHPAMAALARRRHRPQDAQYDETIALLKPHRLWMTSNQAQIPSVHHSYYWWEQALETAAQMRGYRVETFYAEDYPVADRLWQVIQNRGYIGAILGPSLQRMQLPSDLSLLPYMVSFGHLTYPGVSHCQIDTAGAIDHALDALEAHDYQRIALLLPPGFARPGQTCWLGQYLIWKSSSEARRRRLLPPLITDEEAPFWRYIQQHRPDAVLGLQQSRSWLLARGYRIPQDIAHAHLSIFQYRIRQTDKVPHPFSGLDVRPEELGHATLELLHDAIQLNRRPLRHAPRQVSIPSRWHEGQSA